MQRVLVHLYNWQITEKAILAAILWMSFAFILPSRVANFDFRHFVADEGMTISFSASAPPMAALEDEHLPVVAPTVISHVEPVITHPIAVVTKQVARRQKMKVSRYARTGKLKSHHISAFARHIAQLKSLVQAIPSDPMKRPSPSYRTNNVRQVAAATIQKEQRNSQTLRQRVEAPLIAPSVPRSLPRGEEAPPVVIEKDHVSMHRTPSFEVTVPKSQEETYESEVSAPGNPAGALMTSHNVNNPGRGMNASNRAPAAIPPRQMVQAPPPPNPLVSSNAPVASKQNYSSKQSTLAQAAHSLIDQSQGIQSIAVHKLASPQTTEIMALDGGGPKKNADQDQYRITGQVQLTGGLAIAGSNNMTIQWLTGNQTRDARIDYSTGNFSLSVPTLLGGKVIGLLKDDSGHTLGRGEIDLTEIEVTSGQTQIDDVDLIIEAQQTLVRGQILSAYSVGKLIVPVKGAEIFGPASSRDMADSKGGYRLSQINGDSTMILDTFASEHWGTRVIAAGSTRPKIPLFADKMLQSFLEIIDQSRETADYGIVWGEVNHKGQPMAGVSVAISTTDAVGPIYFNELRIPDKTLTATTSNGLYAFVKVKPGLHVVSAEYKKHELPSAVTSVSASMVSYSKILFTSLTVAGHVLDPVAQVGLKAQISVVGSSMTTMASTEGFNFKIPSSDPLVFVEANAGPAYLISRVAVPRKEARNINLFVYHKEWLATQLQKANVKYDGTKGIIFGSIDIAGEGAGYRVRIDDQDIQAKQADRDLDNSPIYFNSDGVPDTNLAEGLAGGGGFMIPNLSPGLHTLVINSADGEMTSSRLFVSEGGVVNVLTMPLRP